VAVDEESGQVLGLYILHPNNIGRCGHIANASYAVSADARGKGVGRALVKDSIAQLAPCGFTGLQFNAVVASNTRAIALYKKLGFTKIGTIPGGFKNGEGALEDIHIFYYSATQAR
jgi:ribosomal protein S18 acetylase RimI-like enzyme